MIAAITLPAFAGDCTPASQPVPRRAVRRTAAGLLPPIQSGSGLCTGRGAIEASS